MIYMNMIYMVTNHLPNDDWYEHDWVDGFFGEYAWNMIKWSTHGYWIRVYDWVAIWISMWGFLRGAPKKQNCSSSIGKQGNRLTRKGDKFEIEIFEAKRQNAGICGTCQRMFATWQACDSSSKKCISPARWVNFVLRVLKKSNTLGILWFSSFPYP